MFYSSSSNYSPSVFGFSNIRVLKWFLNRSLFYIIFFPYLLSFLKILLSSLKDVRSWSFLSIISFGYFLGFLSLVGYDLCLEVTFWTIFYLPLFFFLPFFFLPKSSSSPLIFLGNTKSKVDLYPLPFLVITFF